ncbi:MAG: hypothetical protein WBR32_07510, partial [Pseudolabrys sp.]
DGLLIKDRVCFLVNDISSLEIIEVRRRTNCPDGVVRKIPLWRFVRFKNFDWRIYGSQEINVIEKMTAETGRITSE